MINNTKDCLWAGDSSCEDYCRSESATGNFSNHRFLQNVCSCFFQILVDCYWIGRFGLKRICLFKKDNVMSVQMIISPCDVWCLFKASSLLPSIEFINLRKKMYLSRNWNVFVTQRTRTVLVWLPDRKFDVKGHRVY